MRVRPYEKRVSGKQPFSPANVVEAVIVQF